MPGSGRVSIDIADGSQSVTKSVQELLGEDTSISSDDLQLLANGWVRLRKGGNNLYMSPHAVDSVLVEDGEIATSE